mmetsp:Transcript_40085/g.76617  ORF Transcript_40085/g.76617 Transcript_40085/m.76617 type:complete len:221 (+) Transcript_40085:340-1002(+)
MVTWEFVPIFRLAIWVSHSPFLTTTYSSRLLRLFSLRQRIEKTTPSASPKTPKNPLDSPGGVAPARLRLFLLAPTSPTAPFSSRAARVEVSGAGLAGDARSPSPSNARGISFRLRLAVVTGEAEGRYPEGSSVRTFTFTTPTADGGSPPSRDCLSRDARGGVAALWRVGAAVGAALADRTMKEDLGVLEGALRERVLRPWRSWRYGTAASPTSSLDTNSE